MNKEMSEDSLKYQKRAWHKISGATVIEVSKNEKGYLSVLFAITKTKLLQCAVFSFKLKDEVEKFRPNQKMTIWISVESKKHNDRYFNNIHLMHYELPKPKYKEPTEEKPFSAIDFGESNFE